MKKILFISLFLIVLLAVFSGCAGKETTNLNDTTTNADTADETNEELKFRRIDEEYYEVSGLVDKNKSEIKVPKEFNGKTVKAIGSYAFQGSKVSKVILPVTIETIGGYAFSECNKLTSIYLPDSLKSIGTYAFNATSILEINIPRNVTSIAPAVFNNCTKLRHILVEFENQNYKSIDGVLFSKDGYTLISYPIRKSETSYNVPSGVTTIGESAFSYCNLSAIYLPNTLKTIGKNAFNDSSYLQVIDIQSGAERIEAGAFGGCRNIDFVRIPNSVYYIGDSAFSGCSNLDKVELPESIDTIGSYAFYGTKLSEIKIPKNVETIGVEAFGNCSKLKNIEVDPGNPAYKSKEGVLFSKNESILYLYPAAKGDPVFKVPQKVKVIQSHAFKDCAYLVEVIIFASVNEIQENAFINCNKLYIHCEAEEKPTKWHNDWNADNRTVFWNNKMGYFTQNGIVFDLVNGKYFVVVGTDNYNKQEVVIPSSLYGFPVREIGGGAFMTHLSLTKITLPNTIVKIGGEAFAYSGLRELNIPSSVVTINSDAFLNCSGLVSFSVDSESKYYKSIDGVLFTKDGSTLVSFPSAKDVSSYTIPNGVTTIGSCAFYGCTKLTNIVIPDSVTLIGERAFYAASKLSVINIPKGVAKIEKLAFNGIEELTSINVSEENEKFKSINGVLFSKDLSTLYIYPKGKVGTTYEVPEGVETIDNWAFGNCSSLISITLPEGVKSIGEFAFTSCINLSKIYFPSTLKVMGMYAFSNCVSLREAVFQNGINIIPEYAFYNCESLFKVVIPESVHTIDWLAFSDCQSLSEIIIPIGVTRIGISAFDNCFNLTIYAEAEQQPDGWHAKWNPKGCPVVWGYNGN